MRKITLFLAACLLSATASARVIVGIDAAAHVARGMAAAASAQTIRRNNILRLRLLQATGGQSDAALVARLRKIPGVKFAEIDGTAHVAGVLSSPNVNDPYYGQEWHLFRINAPQAWPIATAAPPVTVAVLDTGVSPVADLAGNLVPGWNILNNSSSTSDWAGHGTAVAGTLGAICNNGAGVAGVNCNVRIMPVVVADQNEAAPWSAIADGIQYAVDHGAQVINISMEDMLDSQAIQSAAAYAASHGVPVVAAAGNYGQEQSYNPGPNMTVVSATDENDNLASFSSYGNYVTVAAPGNDIYTTDSDGSYGIWLGTSFSAPVVSATLAMMRSVNPSLSPAQLQQILASTAVKIGSSIYFGAGRIDAHAAVAAAANLSGATAPPSNPQATSGTLPDFSFISPAPGSAVFSPQMVAIASSNGDAFHRVQFWVDGQLLNDYTGGSFTRYRIAWQGMAAGAHVLKIKVFDGQGNWRWRQERVHR